MRHNVLIALLLALVGLIGSTAMLRADDAPGGSDELLITTDGKPAIIPPSIYDKSQRGWDRAASARTAKRLVQLVQDPRNYNFNRDDLTQGSAQQIVSLAVGDRTLVEALGLPLHEVSHIARISTNPAGSLGKLPMVGITVALHPELTNVPDNAADVIADRVVAGLDQVVREGIERSRATWRRSLETLDADVRALQQESAALRARVEPIAASLGLTLPREPGVIRTSVESMEELRARVARAKADEAERKQEATQANERMEITEQLVPEREKLVEALEHAAAAAGLPEHEATELRVRLLEARLALVQARAVLSRNHAVRSRSELFNDELLEKAERIERELREAGADETDPYRFLIAAGNEMRRIQQRLDELQRTREHLVQAEPLDTSIVVIGSDATP